MGELSHRRIGGGGIDDISKLFSEPYNRTNCTTSARYAAINKTWTYLASIHISQNVKEFFFAITDYSGGFLGALNKTDSEVRFFRDVGSDWYFKVTKETSTSGVSFTLYGESPNENTSLNDYTALWVFYR
ncbi:MAG: hypothetical protein VB112_03190 [Oscillospiraceae bacterium]|nr:hypothetical protein [Oscillospiraceae bacterium]